MANRSETMFSAREMRYLQSLPAVERVSQKRIQYTEEFKRDCMRRYRNGESPAKIFRSAGLDTALIGYKRIERCFARWRRTEEGDDDGGEAPNRGGFEVSQTDRWVGPAMPPVNDGRYFTTRDDMAPDSMDLQTCLLVVAQQARRIDQLEHKVKQLEHRLEGDAAGGDAPEPASAA